MRQLVDFRLNFTWVLTATHSAVTLLSNPDCDVFRRYRVGQALGAPLPAQFILDAEGKLRYKDLFSFLDSNASVETLLEQVQPWLLSAEPAVVGAAS